jgi:phage portal protein BeeE
VQYEEEDSRKLLTASERAAGLWLPRNMMAELRGDSASRGAWYRAMIDLGVFSVNDVRALEDMTDVDGGNSRRASLNYVPLEDWAALSRIRAERGGSTDAE